MASFANDRESAPDEARQSVEPFPSLERYTTWILWDKARWRAPSPWGKIPVDPGGTASDDHGTARDRPRSAPQAAPGRGSVRRDGRRQVVEHEGHAREARGECAPAGLSDDA